MYSQESFEIVGFEQRPVPNRFLSTTDGNRLAVFLPGFAYPLEAPLFYYATSLLGSLGFDLLGIDTRYSENRDYLQKSGRERARWIEEDSIGIHQAVTAREGYEQVVFIGKSLGTSAMLHILSRPMPWRSVGFVWLTPATEHATIAERIRDEALPSLWIVGTGDEFFRAEEAHILEQCEWAEVRLVRGGDHGLDLEGDAVASARELSVTLQWIRRFVEALSK